MYKIVIVLFGSLSCILNISCNQTDNKKPVQLPSKEIGYKILSKNEILRIVEKSIGISSIEKGVLGTQIRIWGDDDTLPHNSRLIIFDSMNNKWSGRVCTIEFPPPTGPEVKVSNHHWKSLPQPTLGWDVFMNNLYNLGILTLPDMTEIPGYGDDLSTGEFGYTFEVAKSQKYRTYSYSTPAFRETRFKEAKNVVEILKAIDAEFHSFL